MTIKVLRDEKFNKEYAITISSQEIQVAKEEWAENNAKHIRIDGFRPGKAPLAIVLKNYGEKAYEQAVNKLLKGKRDELVKAHNLGEATLENIDQTSKDDKGETYQISFSVPPAFDLIDPKKLKLDNLVPDPSKKLIEDFLLTFRIKSAKLHEKSKDGVVEQNDLVHCDVEIWQKDEKIKDCVDVPVRFFENLSKPGPVEELLKTKILGQKVDDLVIIESLKLKKAEHNFEVIDGKSVTLKVKIKRIVAFKFLEDEGLCKIFHVKDMKELRERAKKEASEGMLSDIAICHKRYLFDALDNAYNFELSKDAIDHEFKTVWDQFLSEKASFAKEKKTHPDLEGKTEKEVEKEYHKVAERRVRLSHILSKVAATESIRVTGEDLSRFVFDNIVLNYGEEYANRLLAELQKNEALRNNYIEMVLEDKVARFLHGKASLNDIKVTEEDLSNRLSAVLPR